MVFKAMAIGGGAGTPGADGKTVRSGSGAPSGGLGVDGDFYIDTVAFTIYGPKASGSWGPPTSLIGPTGTGTPGVSGFVGFCGDGSDGNVTIAANTTLTRDMFYDTLTVNSTRVLNTGGFRIHCKTALVNNGTITNPGFAGVGTNNLGGAGAAAGTLGGGGNGSNGGANAGGTRAAATAALGGPGGAGGTGSGGPGGVGQPVAAAAVLGHIRCLPQAATGTFNGFTYSPVFGGGAGGGGGGNTSTSGAGGGGGAGVIIINAKTVTNNSVISAPGGNGLTATGSNCGGGGGGGGGVIIINTTSFTGNTPTVAGGTPGNGNGTGTVGIAGTVGIVLNNVWV